jgi:hypothetical protein
LLFLVVFLVVFLVLGVGCGRLKPGDGGADAGSEGVDADADDADVIGGDASADGIGDGRPIAQRRTPTKLHTFACSNWPVFTAVPPGGGAFVATWAGCPVDGPGSPSSSMAATASPPLLGRLTPDGEVAWTRSLDELGAGTWLPSAIARGNHDDVFVAVWSLPAEDDAGPSAPISVGLLHIDGRGQLLWKHFVPASVFYDTLIETLVVDRDDSVVMAGAFVGAIDWGGGPMTSTHDDDLPIDESDAFVARLAADGSHVWSTRVGGKRYQQGQSLGLSSDGRIFLGGLGVLGTSSDLKGTDPWFLASFASNGALRWAHTYDGSINNGVLVGAIGTDAVVVGGFEDTVDIAGTTLTSRGAEDFFVARFDADGAPRWVHAYGSGYHDNAAGLVVDSLDRAFVISGHTFAGFDPPLDLGAGPFLGPFGDAAFVAKMSEDGALVWTSVLGGGDGSLDIYGAPTLGLDDADTVYASGFGPVGMYLMKLAP